MFYVDKQEIEAQDAWRAVEIWMEGKSEEEMAELVGQHFVVEGEGERITFTVTHERDEFYAERTDGEQWEIK
jgi:hypothetical protein